MHFQRLDGRLKKLEHLLTAPDDRTFTFEELCRAQWKTNKSEFIKIARGTSAALFIAHFQREDAESDQSARSHGETRRRR